MNFNNIYRESLSKIYETIISTDKEHINEAIGHAVDTFMSQLRDNHNLDTNTFFIEWKKKMDTKHKSRGDSLEQLLNTEKDDKYSISVDEIKELKGFLKKHIITIASTCGAKRMSQDFVNKVLSFIINIHPELRAENGLVGKCLDEYAKAKATADENATVNLEKIYNAFKGLYKKKRLEVEQAASPNSVVMDKELYKKVTDKIKSKTETEEGKRKFEDEELNYVHGIKVFSNIDPRLAWMDKTYVKNDSSFIYSQENVWDANLWFDYVMRIETDVYSQSLTEVGESNPQELFKKILDDFMNLQNEYKDLMGDDAFKKYLDGDRETHAALRGIGKGISALSLTLGAFTYGLGAFIPGGSYYAQMLSKIALFGRRAGKLISNKGSTLDSKRNNDEEKRRDKVEKKEKRKTSLKDIEVSERDSEENDD